MKRPIQTATLAGMALAFASAVQAAPITTWTVNVNTSFVGSSVEPPPPGVTIVSPTELRWGSPASSAGDSGLIITDTPANTLVNTNGATVANVSITHRNNPVFAPSLTEVDIQSILTLTPFNPAGGALPPATIIFNVKFLETTNNPTGSPGTCADGTVEGTGLNVNGCADIFVIDQQSLNFNFQYPDIGGDTPGFLRDYFISFFELTSGLNPLPSQACTAASATAPCLGFRTPEEETTTVQFASLITTEPVQIVPEPGTLALLGFGLAAAGFVRRRGIKT